MPSKTTAIGIDLGTTFSCVAVFKKGKVEVIANDSGSRTTPSVVAFSEDERMIGVAAVNQAARNAGNTIYDVKRLIGQNFSDPKVQDDLRHFPFDVSDENDQTLIKVSFKGESKLFSPVEISAMVLSKMKETAETFLGEEIESAVITVPAYFNNNQRQATRDAGQIAGLNVLRILNEPTAAAIAYGLDRKSENEQNVLIFDLGGGTFDVSILSVKDGVQVVKSTAGDTHLGGEDFVNRLVDYAIEEFKKKYDVDLTKNPRAIRYLRNECEKAKRTLSTSTYADIGSVIGEEDYICTVSRATFEDINKDLFEDTIECVRKTLKDAGLNMEDIDEIVLVGGSTRIPKIQQLLQNFFDGKKLNKTINPDEAVACGAAVLAANIINDDFEEKSHLTLIDVAPLSLGTAVGLDYQMSVIIPRNTVIPTKKTQCYETMNDNQTRIRVDVYEGERAFVKDNNLLGGFTMHDIKQSPAGVECFDITFQIDFDGILTVTAVDDRSGNQKQITIENTNRLSKTTIERMVKEAETYRLEDQKTIKRNSIKMKFESYHFNLKANLKFFKEMSGDDKKRILEQCCGVALWFDRNPTAEPDECDLRLQDLEAFCNTVIEESKKDLKNEEKVNHEDDPEPATTEQPKGIIARVFGTVTSWFGK